MNVIIRQDKVDAVNGKVYAAIEANDKDAAQSALLAATSAIDKATKKGVYHKNTSARKVSRMSLAVNKMA